MWARDESQRVVPQRRAHEDDGVSTYEQLGDELQGLVQLLVNLHQMPTVKRATARR